MAMISENIIKTKFIVDTLKRQTDIFYKRESERFGNYLQSKTGETRRMLSSPDFIITASGEDFMVVAKITKQLRLQDFGRRDLYTRPMYSVMLGRVKSSLQYGLSNEIREFIVKQLSDK